MKRNSGNVPLLTLVFLATSLLFSIGFLSYGARDKSKPVIIQQSDLVQEKITLTPTPIQQVDRGVVVSGNTYHNNTFRFNISAPNGWNIVNDYPRIYITNLSPDKINIGSLTHGLPGSFEILVYENDKWHTDDFNNRISKLIPAKNVSGKEYSKIEKINVFGATGYKEVQFDISEMAQPGGFETIVSFLREESKLINLIYPSSYNKNYGNAIYEEIFSTFRFY